MELTIDATKENPFVKRKEIKGKISFTGATPAYKQVIDAISAKTGVKPEAINVVHVYTSFGAQTASFEAEVYPNREQLEKYVRLGKKAKEKLAKPAPAPAEQKPAETKPEKKEAPKPEEKKAEAKPEVKAEPKKEEPKKAEA